nr:MAG TPA: hypothetical protein [Caudoviricetes sp.]
MLGIILPYFVNSINPKRKFCRFMEYYSSCIFLHSVLFFYYIT